MATGLAVNKKYIGTYFSNNIAGGSPNLESFMEARR